MPNRGGLHRKVRGGSPKVLTTDGRRQGLTRLGGHPHPFRAMFTSAELKLMADAVAQRLVRRLWELG